MSKPRLLACPFCGEQKDLDVLDYWGRFPGPHFVEISVVCHTCGSLGPEETSGADAILAWNRRARPALPNQHSKWTKTQHTMPNQQARQGKAKKNEEE